MKIIHINLPYANVEYLYNNYCKKKFNANDLIILTLPTPKQEQFAELISANNNYYKVLCVGGAISMLSGDEKPIPDFLENLGLEFIWRLRTDTYRRVIRLIQSFTSYLHGEFNKKFSNIHIKVIK
jgi:UDP-N-acetyl-D-mannosaminuronic acid transferase (WecB/TagA/CpsF family)